MKIKNRWTQEVIFEHECATIKEAVVEAIKRGINLYGADLLRANLRGADLSGANLSGASLFRADLFRADLYGANLSRANLREANLRRADLRGADLRGADLFRADLREAIGNMREIHSMQIEKYHIVWNAEIMWIGCECHSHKEWFNFTDSDIEKMDTGALKWWNKWKEFVKTAIELSVKHD